MVYPLGVTTAEGIIASLKFAFQVYQEVKQAEQKYKAAKQIQKSIDLSLCLLESRPGGLEDFQVEAARNSWLALGTYLEEYGRIFEEPDDVAITSKVSKKLKWACTQLDNKMELLRTRIDTCLVAILPTLLVSNR